VVALAAEIGEFVDCARLTRAVNGLVFEERERANGELVGRVYWVKAAPSRRTPKGMAT
jgi:hypothetical protein